MQGRSAYKTGCPNTGTSLLLTAFNHPQHICYGRRGEELAVSAFLAPPRTQLLLEPLSLSLSAVLGLLALHLPRTTTLAPPHPPPPPPLCSPVESNPEVFNEYSARLGWPVERYAWADLLSTEPWALDMLQQPVRAVAMLFLIKEAHEEHAAAEEAARAAAPAPSPASLPLFIKQDIPNACGTLALLHALASAAAVTGGDVELAEDSWLRSFLARVAPLSPQQRADALAEDDAMEEEQAVAVEGGQSEQVDDTMQHFVCFVEKGGRLWELDGRKGGPVDHGPTSPASLLKDAVAVLQKFMARDPEEVRFTMLALCPPSPEEE